MNPLRIDLAPRPSYFSTMPARSQIKPTHKAVKAYYAALEAHAQQSVVHEGAARSAFQNLPADMGIDGRIYLASATPRKRGAATGELDFMDVWYPIQVKQKDKVGRPDIDSFEAVMTREDRTKGFFVGFNHSDDALREIDAFFRKSGKVIVAVTVREILEEQIAKKLV